VIYIWTKVLHLLFVIAWMASVFYLPRILVNLTETTSQRDVRARLLLMGQRLYGFGHTMFAIAVAFGLLLWLGHHVAPAVYPDTIGGMHWIDAKLGLVALILAYYIVTGRWLKRAAAGGALPSSATLRWFNEIPLLLLIPILYLVLARPF
jgi:putative membrane protein